MQQFIFQIAQEVFNEEPIAIQSLHGGFWASVYRVDLPSRKVAIKIQAKSVSGFQMEQALMQRLRLVGVKTPIPVACGEWQEGKGYLAMSYSEGPLLEEVWSSLPQVERKRLRYQFLEMLEKVNSVVVNGYGPLSPNLEGAFATFKDYLLYQIDHFAQNPVRAGIDNQIWDSLTVMLVKCADEYADTEPHLVHADFRMRNLIYDNGNLTLIDFGNALGMLPGFDFYRFTRVDRSETLLSESEIAMLTKEYTSINPHYEYERPMFQAILGMRLAPFSAMTGNSRLVKVFLDDIIGTQRQLQSCSSTVSSET